jgi:hypothetical protein
VEDIAPSIQAFLTVQIFGTDLVVHEARILAVSLRASADILTLANVLLQESIVYLALDRGRLLD